MFSTIRPHGTRVSRQRGPRRSVDLVHGSSFVAWNHPPDRQAGAIARLDRLPTGAPSRRGGAALKSKDFMFVLDAYKPGDKVKVAVVRDGKRLELTRSERRSRPSGGACWRRKSCAQPAPKQVATPGERSRAS
jgi:hypothetical protein